MTIAAPMAEESADNLPATWQLIPLRKLLLALETGSRPKGGAIGVTDGVPSLSAEHMTRFGTFDFETMRYVPREFYESMTRGHIERNDILIVKDGATTGKTAFVDDEFPFDEAVVNEHVFLCRPDPTIVIPKFLFYCLWGTVGQSAIRERFQGAAIGGINQTFADSVLIPIPSLPEQERLLVQIECALETVRIAAAASETRTDAINRFRAALLRDAFMQAQVISAPQTSIGEIASLVIDGPHVTPVYVSSGIPFITVRNIVNRRLDFLNTSFITEADHQTFSSRGKVEVGDILYSKDGTLGIPCLVDDAREFSFFVSVALIKLLRDMADPQYVAFALESPQALQQVELLAAGAGLKHMVLKSIRRLRLHLPSLDVQRCVAKQLKARLEVIVRVSQDAAIQEKAIGAIPRALLREAFSGRL